MFRRSAFPLNQSKEMGQKFVPQSKERTVEGESCAVDNLRMGMESVLGPWEAHDYNGREYDRYDMKRVPCEKGIVFPRHAFPGALLERLMVA